MTAPFDPPRGPAVRTSRAETKKLAPSAKNGNLWARENRVPPIPGPRNCSPAPSTATRRPLAVASYSGEATTSGKEACMARV